METLPKSAALLIIDVQEAFHHPSWGFRNNPDAEQNIARLLHVWRSTGRPVYHVQHISTRTPGSLFDPQQPTSSIQPAVAPLDGETVITKNVNSAFIGTNLEIILRQQQVDTLVITGLTTNHCVETTTRMAGNLGFHTYLVSDGCATFDRVGPRGNHVSAEDIHEMTLVNLHQEFATIVDTAKVLTMIRNEL